MKITEVMPLEDFRLFLRFEDGVSGEVDLSGYAGRGVFASWLKNGVFQQAMLNDSGTVEWPGEIDLCPDALYLRLTDKSPGELFPTLRNRPAHA